MKGMMNNDVDQDENGNDNNNWLLGFSLSASPHDHMKMELMTTTNNDNTTTSADNHQSFYHLSTSSSSSDHHQINNNNNSYDGHHDNNNNFNNNNNNSSILMPVKSDGSLCFNMAHDPFSSKSHSQGMVQTNNSSSSSPKLEDFLGGTPTMTNHNNQDYSIRGGAAGESMVLSLDSLFYNQEVVVPFTHNHHDHYYTSTLHNSNNIYQHPQISDHEMKMWFDHHHHHQENHHAAAVLLEQQQQQQQHNNNNNNSQSLSLSMSPGSQSSSCVTASRPSSSTTHLDHQQTNNITTTDVAIMENGNTTVKKRGSEKMVTTGGGQKQIVHRKSIDNFGQRTSQYRGVTRHRWTGRYEAHLWDNSCKKEGQTRKGRQVYLGGYDMEEKAARSYDLAALKYWGPSTHINFSLDNYPQELEEMKNMTRQEFVAHLRRKSSGFSRGASIYRGVTRHHQHGRWQARIGRVAGNKDLYLGTFSTQEEAAEAYDVAAIKFRGANAVTNFDISRYNVEKIMASNTLPAGDVARRNKGDEKQPQQQPNAEGSAFAQVDNNVGAASSDWKMAIHNQTPTGTMNAENNYQNLPYSVGQHCLSTGLDVDDQQRTSVVQHFSNPSSLVTSLGSSREGSPDKNAGSLMFSSNLNTWITTAQLMPSVEVTTAHMPLFATWNDA